jgi:hypothetical protein
MHPGESWVVWKRCAICSDVGVNYNDVSHVTHKKSHQELLPTYCWSEKIHLLLHHDVKLKSGIYYWVPTMVIIM